MASTLVYDVVIVGAGPAGLLAATWMARTGVKTLIIEKRASQSRVGRADGLEGRTLEILDSFGLASQIWKEANQTIEISIWCDLSDGSLHRHRVSPNTEPGWSRFGESTLAQSRIEEHLLTLIESSSSVEIRRGTVPKSMDYNFSTNDETCHPIKLTFSNANEDPQILRKYEYQEDSDSSMSDASHPRSLSLDSTYSEIDDEIYAKYVIGCDGAHSWVRQQLGLTLEGESVDEYWGVLDLIPVTSFPDIRKRCILKRRNGTLMLIPREQSMVRVYFQIPNAIAIEYKKQPCPNVLLQIVQLIMQPYSFRTSQIDWSTVYQAGQGMNVSMQDAYNLGWKLASVIHGVTTPEILKTYHEERHPVAERLMNLDKRLCQGMRSSVDAYNATDDIRHSHKQALSEENTLAAGVAVSYAANKVVAPICTQDPVVQAPCQARKASISKRLQVGSRIPSDVLLNHYDAQRWELHDMLPSTGQWNLVVFGGDISNKAQLTQVSHLSEWLHRSDSPFRQLRSRRVGLMMESVNAVLIHSAPRKEIEFLDIPEIFRPYSENFGYSYCGVFADNVSYDGHGGKVYETFGIDPRGCMALVRPDQHVAFLGALEEVHELDRFIASFLK
ncbi:hypothetical protein PENSTE_c001G02711 [Penicillium steckii]|uniref:FAD-binding domain-containing protein n=1 Tax=Penicillium steckii TaxID=303698 RepID=A0A1V6TZ06_9EURO|nr:hypothetical protein PENSTE_c001G02711 [Penicillium steckii]